MNNRPTNDDFEIDHLIKQVAWPNPSRDLAFRIQNEVARGEFIAATDTIPLWQFRSPLLGVIAVALALCLGIASGMMSSNAASATDYDVHPYSSASSVSVVNLYSGQ